MELEHEPDLVAPEVGQSIVVERADVHSVDHDGAARRRVESAEKIEERRLPTARLPDDRHELTGSDLEIDAVQDRHRHLAAIGLPQIARLYHDRPREPPRALAAGRTETRPDRPPGSPGHPCRAAFGLWPPGWD